MKAGKSRTHGKARGGRENGGSKNIKKGTGDEKKLLSSERGKKDLTHQHLLGLIKE